MAEKQAKNAGETATPMDSITPDTAEEARVGAVCLPQVTELVNHLRTTGTGQSKLDKLTELGKLSKDLDQFMKMAPANVPAATMQKVEEFVTSQVIKGPAKEAMKEDWANTTQGKDIKKRYEQSKGKGGRVETRSQDQSSLPEYTIIDQNKAPVLQEAGSSQTKQLGSDVIPPEGEKPGDKEGKGGDEEAEDADAEVGKSSVADLPADEAKDAISRKRSVEVLQAIVDHDTRSTVQEAARKRLEEINK